MDELNNLNENVIIRNKNLSDSTLIKASNKIITDSEEDEVNGNGLDEDQQKQLNNIISTIDLNDDNNGLSSQEGWLEASTKDVDVENETKESSQQQNQKAGSNANTVSSSKACQFSISRVKNIMKLDPELSLTSKESVFLVAKATVIFFSKWSFVLLFIISS